jgi:hypothetical protein
VADAGQHVVERAIDGVGKANAVGGDDRHLEGRRQIAQQVIVGFLVAQQVPLQLDADAAPAEGADQAVEDAGGGAAARAVEQEPSGQRDEPAGVAVEVGQRQRALPLRRRELHPRDEPRQVAIALARGDEHRQRYQPCRACRLRRACRSLRLGPERDRHLGADDGLQPGAAGGKVKPGDAIDAVAIEQRQRRIPQIRRALHERLRQRSAVQKRKRRGGMKFDIHSNLQC